MPGFRFGLAPIDYVPSIVGTPVANRPVTNVELYLHQLRTFRSATTSANDSRIICDLGTAKTVRHVLLGNCNFSGALIETASNSAITTSVVSNGVATVGLDRRTGRRNIWITISNPQARQFLRLTPSTIVGSLGVYEVGVLALFDGITELVQSPGWPKLYTIRQAQTRTQFASGGEDVSEDGVRYVEMTLHKDHWTRGSGVQAQLFDILDAGVAGPIVVYENLGDSSAAWVTRRVNDVAFQERYVTFNTELTFRESI